MGEWCKSLPLCSDPPKRRGRRALRGKDFSKQFFLEKITCCRRDQKRSEEWCKSLPLCSDPPKRRGRRALRGEDFSKQFFLEKITWIRRDQRSGASPFPCVQILQKEGAAGPSEEFFHK